MATYVILSRISPEAVKDPKNLKDLAKTVSETIKQQCPGVIWKDSYATSAPPSRGHRALRASFSPPALSVRH
jgi:hypothetical protein